MTVLFDLANLLRYNLGTGQMSRTVRLASRTQSNNSNNNNHDESDSEDAREKTACDEEAQQLYRGVVALEPHHASAWAELAQLQFDLTDDVVRSRQLFDKAISGSLASKRQQQQQPQQAQPQSTIAIASARVWTMYGKFLADMGDVVEAEKKFKAVRQLRCSWVSVEVTR